MISPPHLLYRLTRFVNSNDDYAAVCPSCEKQKSNPLAEQGKKADVSFLSFSFFFPLTSPRYFLLVPYLTLLF